MNYRNQIRNAWRWAVLICVVCLVPLAAFAQRATGSIQGMISDQTGAIIPNAVVTVTNSSTGAARQSTSNNDGLYNVPDLQPGEYTISVEAKGFGKESAERVTVTVGAQLTTNFKLSAGSDTQSITVSGVVLGVDTVSSTVKPVVSERTIVDLPLNGRDWTQLAVLQPGVDQVKSQPAVSVANQRANRGIGNQLTIGGGRPQGNNYRVDGISINDYSNGGPGGVIGSNLGVDAIQEFSVVTSNPTADYGKTSGGVVNAVTRSGSNKWHGDFYEFFRNSALDARNEFDKPGQIAEFRRNQFGAAAGGPLVKDKTFIFGDYEGLRQFQGANVSSVVPSDAAKQGKLVSGPITVNPAVVPYLQFYPSPNSTVT